MPRNPPSSSCCSKTPAAKRQADSDAAIPVSRDETVRQLEAQVLQLKTELRATIERYDRFAADNTGVTEELQAVNEELRSSSEELETSKEELQSLNEELQTVNQELKLKIEEQTRFNDDLQNLVHSTEIGTIFLDRALNIKLFTPAVRALFNLIPADRGRPLSDITTVLDHPGLHQDLARVMETLERVEREVLTRDGRWLLMRAHPYRTADDRIDGVVLAFVDVTSGKRAEAQLQRSEARLRLVLESVADYAIYTLDSRRPHRKLECRRRADVRLCRGRHHRAARDHPGDRRRPRARHGSRRAASRP